MNIFIIHVVPALLFLLEKKNLNLELVIKEDICVCVLVFLYHAIPASGLISRVMTDYILSRNAQGLDCSSGI